MKLLATVGAFLFSGIVAATPLHNIVVFGDSLSDNGNLYEVMKHQLPQSPPYYLGRFSDGPVWIEHLVASYFPQNPTAHLLDYAYGGAGVSEDDDEGALFTLRKEIDTYLLSHEDKANADDLYVVWIGANNYLALPEELNETLTNVNTGIVHGVQRLVEKGAKHILIINLPDLGKTPAALEFNAVDVMGYFAKQHNDTLRKTFMDFKNTYPEVDWLYFDLGHMFDLLMENPTEFGFTNVTDPCSSLSTHNLTKKSILNMVSQVRAPKLNNACEEYVFFDLVHPTGAAHKAIAAKARSILDEAGIEFKE